jgi:hypothetical protein
MEAPIDDPTSQEGCHQRKVPYFSGSVSTSSTASGTAADVPEASESLGNEEETCSDDEIRQLTPAEVEEFSRFMFPHMLNSDCLGDGKVNDDEDEDTDPVEELGLVGQISNAKMFTDPVEREKWKDRGWKAVQCCGGALLVLALIFDEMD